MGFCEGPVGVGCRPLKTILQDESLLECPKNVVESPLGQDLALRSKERVSSKLKLFNWLVREEVLSNEHFSKLANLNSLVGMSVEGFENEIFSLLRKRKMKKRRGHGACVSRGRRKLNLTSCFKREI